MKSWIFIGLLFSMMCGGAYYYYTTTQETIQILIENNATMKSDISRLTDANQQNLTTIDRLQDEYVTIQNNFNRLQSDFQIIRDQNDQLAAKFEDRDLNQLATTKPKLVENIINNATDDALRCFELLSGAPLTEDEKQATNENEFNSECPFLWIYP